MRRPNVRFLVLVVVAALLVAVTAHLVHGYQTKRTAGILLVKAREFREADDLGSAIGYYGRYLHLAPEDTEALAEYGLALAKGQPASAGTQMVLEQVLRREPAKASIRRALIDVAMQLNHVADARVHLEALSPPAGTPATNVALKVKEAELEIKLGQCYEAEGKHDAAQRRYRDAISLSPENAQAYVALASLLREKLKQADEADKVMNSLVEQNSESVDAYRARGLYWQTYGRPSKALADAEAALKLNPLDTALLLLAANAARETDDLDKSLAFARQARKQAPQDPLGHLMTAQLELAKHGQSAAVQVLQEGLEALPQNVDLLWHLGNLQVEREEFDELAQLIKRLQAIPKGRDFATYLEGRKRLQQGDVMGAVAQFEAVRGKPIDRLDLKQQIELWLGICADRIDNVDQRIAAYRRAVDVNPSWEPAQVGLASALTAAGQVDEALKIYGSIMSAPRVRVGTNEAVCRLLIMQQLQLPPEQRNWQIVQDVWKQAAQNNPDSPSLAILLAEILVAKGRPDRAIEALAAICAKKPDAMETWIARAALLAQQSQSKEALAVLDEAQEKLGDRAAFRQQRIRLALDSTDDTEASVDRLCQNWDAYSKDEQFNLSRLAGAIYSTLGATKKADHHWAQATKLRPEWLPGYLYQFTAAATLGDEDRLQALLEQIRGLEGNERGPLWSYGEAVRLVVLAEESPENLKSARHHLSETIVQRPRWPQPHVLLAEIEKADGNFSTATEQYLAALDLGDRSPQLVRDLVILLFQRQRFAEADQVLRRVESQQATFSSDLNRLASEVSWRAEDYGRSLRLAKLAAEESTKIDDLLWLGQLHSQMKSFDEAEAAYRKAVELQPQEKRVWLAFAQHWIRQNDPEKVDQTLAEASKHLPPEQLALARAQTLAALGRVDAARAEFRHALELVPDDGPAALQAADFFVRQNDMEDAERVLRHALKPEVRFSADERADARRRLALVIAQYGRYAQLKEAEALIKENEDETRQPRNEDLRVKAVVLTGMPGHLSRQQGIQILESLVSQPVPSDQDRFLLARMYEAEGQWPKARKLLQSLLTSEKVQVAHLTSYISGLLNHNEPQEAETWLPKLVSMDPNGLYTAALQARVEVFRGRADAAIATVDAYAKKADSKVSAGWSAQILERLAGEAPDPAAVRLLRTAAEKHYRETIDADSRQQAPALLFLAREGRVTEALDLCAMWIRQTSSMESLLTSLSIVEQPGATRADRLRAESLVQNAIASGSDSADVQTALGSFYESHDRVDEAILAYRRALRLAPTAAPAMNNLALLLADRNETKEALQIIDHAIDVHGDAAALLDSRGSIRLAAGQVNDALTDFSNAVADQPSPLRLFHLAQAQYRAQQIAKAKESFRRALEGGLNPEQLHALEKVDFARMSK